MRRKKFTVPPAAFARRAGVTHASSPSSWAAEQRLQRVERELGVQFTRIAQLQAEVDLLSAALRRSPATRVTRALGVLAARGLRT